MRNKSIIGKETVLEVARLARLNLTDEELSLYGVQLGAILEYIDQLKGVDTEKTLPTSHPIEGLKNVFRKDTVKKSLSGKAALQNAPQKKENFFSVPKIIE